jgi:hypothetical protein
VRKCGGWFYLAGELIETGERLTDVAPSFQYFFRGAGIFGPLRNEFGPDVLALEFLAEEPEY